MTSSSPPRGFTSKQALVLASIRAFSKESLKHVETTRVSFEDGRIVMEKNTPSPKAESDADEERRNLAILKLKQLRPFSNEDNRPIQVLPGLFLGSIAAAKNLDALLSFGVTHVVNASPIVPCYHKSKLTYRLIDVYDSTDANISQFFESTSSFIEEGRRGGGGGVVVQEEGGVGTSSSSTTSTLITSSSSRPITGGVLVHCYAGVSRSATIVAAYLLRHEGMPLKQAMQRIREARREACPNPAFMKQLEQYAVELGLPGAATSGGGMSGKSSPRSSCEEERDWKLPPSTAHGA